VTPGERVVVEAARRWYARVADGPHEDERLCEAIRALEAERAAGGTVVTETERTWDQVVEGDEIYSAKTRKWYPVRESGALPDGRWKIVAAGLPKPIRPMASADVMVRRGETGLTVDMFASVLWSMPTLPSQPAVAIEVPVPDVAHDPEASEPDA
jgi:hypothetical protein